MRVVGVRDASRRGATRSDWMRRCRWPQTPRRPPPSPLRRVGAVVLWLGLLSTTFAFHAQQPHLPPLRLSASTAHAHHQVRSSTPECRLAAPAPLPRALLPITCTVFAQMLGEGIAISSLPLHMTRLGAAPVEVGLATSCFSVAQMICCPLLVRRSSKIGRARILRVCLAGATGSSLIIAVSNSIGGIIAGRFLAGVFAASVPVAQSAATDIVSGNQTAAALSRVSAATQSAIVVGPAASGLLQSLFGAMSVPQHLQLRCAFAVSAAFASCVLVLLGRAEQPVQPAVKDVANRQNVLLLPDEKKAKVGAMRDSAASAESKMSAAAARTSQLLLRLMALLVGWTLTLSVSTYGLFAPRFLAFAQAQLSMTYSAGAAITIAVQILFPRLVRRIGENACASLGLMWLALGLGSQSLIRSQPFHSALYLLNRAGAGIADTSIATLVARVSPDKTSRSQNLALIQSTRAGARIVTPLISGKLFELSCSSTMAPGSLPYLVASFCVVAVSPLPFVLRRLEKLIKNSKS